MNNSQLELAMENLYQEFIEPSERESFVLRFQYLLYSKLLTPSLFWFAQNSYRALSRLGIMVGSSSREELECKIPEGYSKRMSSWQRTLLARLLDQIDKTIAHRKWVVSLYEEFLNKKGMKTLKLPDHYDTVFLRYPLLVKNKNKTLKEAEKKRIELGDWFLSPVHPNLDNWEKAGYRKGMCPVAEEVCRHIINLPTHPQIDEKEARKIIKFISE